MELADGQHIDYTGVRLMHLQDIPDSRDSGRGPSDRFGHSRTVLLLCGTLARLGSQVYIEALARHLGGVKQEKHA